MFRMAKEMIPVGKVRVLATMLEIEKLKKKSFEQGYKKGFNRAVKTANDIVHNNALARPEIIAGEIRKLKLGYNKP